MLRATRSSSSSAGRRGRTSSCSRCCSRSSRRSCDRRGGGPRRSCRGRSRAPSHGRRLGLRVPRRSPADSAARPRARRSLLLPALPAALAVIALRRGHLPLVPLASFALPVVGVLAFVATAPLVVDDAPAADVASRPCSRGAGRLRRVPGELAHAGGRLARRCALPELRAARARQHVVPAATSVTSARRCRPRDPDGHRAAPRRAADARGPSGQPLHAARQAVHAPGQRAGHATLPDALLPSGCAAGTVARPPAGTVLRRRRRIHAPGPSPGARGRASADRRTMGRLRQDARRKGQGPGHRRAQPGGMDQARGRSGRPDTGPARGFLRTLRPSTRKPSLYFEHALLPHSPWQYLPSGIAYPHADLAAGVDGDWNRWLPIPWLVDTGLQRHLLQVGYTIASSA